jgi:hypothetical protein
MGGLDPRIHPFEGAMDSKSVGWALRAFSSLTPAGLAAQCPRVPSAWAKSRDSGAHLHQLDRRFCPPYAHQASSVPSAAVMRGLDPRIHLFRKNDGLQRNSGLPEFRNNSSAASRVNPTCGVKPGNDGSL